MCLTLADMCTSALVRSIRLCECKVDYNFPTMATTAIEWLATLAAVPAIARSAGTIARVALRPRSGFPLLVSPTQPFGLVARAA